MGVFTNLFQDEIDFIEEKYKIKILEIKKWKLSKHAGIRGLTKPLSV